MSDDERRRNDNRVDLHYVDIYSSVLTSFKKLHAFISNKSCM